MTRIFRTYELIAGHFLPFVEPGHKCKRAHGHNYKIKLVLSGPLIKGMICDFDEVDRRWQVVHAMLDHRSLNERIENPTAENIAEWIFTRLNWPLVCRVEVWETDTCGAVYEPDSTPRPSVHLPVIP
jgi:6-pyruvoyltetrahydropterin/6-carboxytetrahydropterin synthase